MTAQLKNSFKWPLVLALGVCLGLGLSACGGKKSMEGAGEDEQSGTISTGDGSGVTRLAGEEEGVGQASFDEAEKERRLAALPKGSTASGPGKVNVVTVKAGDTLFEIAKRKNVYASGWLYPLIYNANKALIKDPNHLEAGIKLKIPRDVPSAEAEIAKEDAMSGKILEQGPIGGVKATPVAKAVTEAKPVKASKGGHGWLWVLLLLLVGGGAFAWMKMKKGPAEATAA